MDNTWKSSLRSEARSVGVELSDEALEKISGHVDLLLRWNTKVNLTRITRPDEVRIKHVVDSLGALPLVPEPVVEVLDLGAGAGFPGVPWMAARPALKVTMVDTVGKKVGFLKNAVAQLKLGGRGHQARLEGNPQAEGLAPADLVVSRAFMDIGAVLPLARPYLRPGGQVLAMLGPRESAEQARQIAEQQGFAVEAEREFSLPGGLGERRVLRLVPRGT